MIDLKSKENVSLIIKHISNTPYMTSFLYDMDLLPEQLKEDTPEWYFMMGLGFADKERKKITDIVHHD